MGQATSTDAGQKRKRIVTLVLLATLLISASVFLTGKNESDVIIVTFPNGTELETEVANTPEKLLFGLAFRETLPAGTGMLYIFESTGAHRMRTKAYLVPIDMIWIDEARHVVHVLENVQPCLKDPCPSYGPSPEPARYVIQTGAGFVQREGIQSGAELKFTLRL